MIYFKAKRKAKKISKIINQPCYVVKFYTPKKWYNISTWFRYENVSKDYIDNMGYEGKIYYKTD